ncbi:hypothetical protein GTNG_3259 [Geobacillus thermodenitrificans NG80-2]|uniref:Uncharacterized protein n=1 Tax=Geobacillus thermodenitrificans (strain NG80-2) TaxID=420246 RepID=A4ITE4_GEOTN|nr:hypothetical protein GTNG_3259 [Geobacillus thermodenitrificans NG80-2]
MFTYVCISQQFVLVVEGYMGKEVDDLCYLHRQSVTTYVKKFNKGGMDALLERKCGLGRP